MLCNNVVLNACENSELTLNYYAVSVRVLNYLLGKCDIILIRVVRSVDHYRGKSTVDARLADLKICAVVKVKREVYSAILYRSLCKCYEVLVLCILTCACRYLEDNRGLCLLCRLCDCLNYLHVVNIESAYCVSACIRLLEHFLCRYKCHCYISFPRDLRSLVLKPLLITNTIVPYKKIKIKGIGEFYINFYLRFFSFCNIDLRSGVLFRKTTVGKTFKNKFTVETGRAIVKAHGIGRVSIAKNPIG